ncbi:hypothetical protein JCM10212_006516 [Sporobolomyces blumeae]
MNADDMDFVLSAHNRSIIQGDDDVDIFSSSRTLDVSSASGYICLDILKTSWSPVFTLRTCLVSLQSLLSTPEPNDPQDAEVAKHYLTDRKGFEKTAKYWTEVYAFPKSTSASTSPSHHSSTTSTSTSSTNPRDPIPSTSTSPVLEPVSKRLRRTTTTSRREDQREARLAGIEPRDVETFTEMGFDSSSVIEVLRRLNYRGTNRDQVGIEAVVAKLVGG